MNLIEASPREFSRGNEHFRRRIPPLFFLPGSRIPCRPLLPGFFRKAPSFPFRAQNTVLSASFPKPMPGAGRRFAPIAVESFPFYKTRPSSPGSLSVIALLRLGSFSPSRLAGMDVLPGVSPPPSLPLQELGDILEGGVGFLFLTRPSGDFVQREVLERLKCR